MRNEKKADNGTQKKTLKPVTNLSLFPLSLSGSSALLSFLCSWVSHLRSFSPATFILLRLASHCDCFVMGPGQSPSLPCVRAGGAREVPELLGVLKEMKEGLNIVTSKVQSLTAKVKAKEFPTAGGISYLEAKHLLLVNYCQSLVYYLLRKAEGLSIEGHPVVRSLVEIRLFLEKIRPIDKQCSYRIERLLQAAATDAVKVDTTEKVVEAKKSEDLLNYRPNPDMLVDKTDIAANENNGVYRPPKIAPTTMEEDKKTKRERDVERKDRDTIRRLRQSDYVKSLVADIEGRPEEVRDFVGAETRELSKYIEMRKKREEQEEELFNRAPITKAEKKKEKRLMRSNGLLGLTDDFYDGIKTLPFGDGADEEKDAGFRTTSSMERKHKRRKKKF